MDKILSYTRKDSDDYYAILGCSELSSEEQILTEYKSRVLDCHPDKNLGDTAASEKFIRLAKAKEVLTNPESRAKYDQWRRSGIAMSYDDWCGLRGAAHTSMHWSTPVPKPSITAPYEGTKPALMTPYEGTEESTDIKKTEQVSPRQGTHEPHQYQKAQVIDLTDATGKPVVTGRRIEWEPAPGRPLLQKFRNYEI